MSINVRHLGVDIHVVERRTLTSAAVFTSAAVSTSTAIADASRDPRTALPAAEGTGNKKDSDPVLGIERASAALTRMIIIRYDTGARNGLCQVTDYDDAQHKSFIYAIVYNGWPGAHLNRESDEIKVPSTATRS